MRYGAYLGPGNRRWGGFSRLLKNPASPVAVGAGQTLSAGAEYHILSSTNLRIEQNMNTLKSSYCYIIKVEDIFFS